MTHDLRASTRRLLASAGAVVALLTLTATESPGQVIISSGYPGYGYSYGYGPYGSYSSYGSRYVSGFGLGGFGRTRGYSYSSFYGVPGYGYGGYSGYVGYPGYAYGPGYGYPGSGYGFPGVVPPIGYGPSYRPGGLISGGRSVNAEPVQGGTHIPGFGVVGDVVP